jgi:hypothetical protein
MKGKDEMKAWRVIGLVALSICVWTVTATWIFLLGTGTDRFYPVPYAVWQWWLFAWFASSDPIAAPWLKISALAALAPVAALVRMAWTQKGRTPALYGETAPASRSEMLGSGFQVREKL